MTRLWIDFAGTIREVTGRLAFGRGAELSLDDENRFMHRLTGEFQHHNGAWWLLNTGAATRLIVFGNNGTRIELPPGTEAALPMPSGSVSFIAGPTPYQLLYRTEGEPEQRSTTEPSGESTVDFGANLTDRETIYLTTFALPRLRDTAPGLLAYADVAAIWGVSEKTIDNTLQRVRARLKAAGVRDIETLEGLTNHLLAHGRIGIGTLADIDHRHPGVLPSG